MSHYTLEELIARWKREEVTMEQMIGQLALVLATLEQRLRAVERRVPEEPMPGSVVRGQERAKTRKPRAKSPRRKEGDKEHGAQSRHVAKKGIRSMARAKTPRRKEGDKGHYRDVS